MELPDTSMPVLVLQMQNHGALGVMRSLGRLGVPMYGVHPTRRPPASFSKYCRKVFALDLDQTPPEQSVDCLRDIARGIGATPLLMPTNDESALFVAHNASQLQDVFPVPGEPRSGRVVAVQQERHVSPREAPLNTHARHGLPGVPEGGS